MEPLFLREGVGNYESAGRRELGLARIARGQKKCLPAGVTSPLQEAEAQNPNCSPLSGNVTLEVKRFVCPLAIRARKTKSTDLGLEIYLDRQAALMMLTKIPLGYGIGGCRD